MKFLDENHQDNHEEHDLVVPLQHKLGFVDKEDADVV